MKILFLCLVLVSISFSASCTYNYNSEDPNSSQGLRSVSASCNTKTLNITLSGTFNKSIFIEWKKSYSWNELVLSANSNSIFFSLNSPISSNGTFTNLFIDSLRFYNSTGTLFKFNSKNVFISNFYAFNSSLSIPSTSISFSEESIYQSMGELSLFQMTNSGMDLSQVPILSSINSSVQLTIFDQIFGWKIRQPLLSPSLNPLSIVLANSTFEESFDVFVPFLWSQINQTYQTFRTIEISNTIFANSERTQLKFGSAYSISISGCDFNNISATFIQFQESLNRFKMNQVHFQRGISQVSSLVFMGNISNVLISDVQFIDLESKNLFSFGRKTNYDIILFYQISIKNFTGDSAIYFNGASSSGFFLENSEIIFSKFAGDFVHLLVDSLISDGFQYVFFPSFLNLQIESNQAGGEFISIDGTFIGPTFFTNSNVKSNRFNNFLNLKGEFASVGFFNSSFENNEMNESLTRMNGASTNLDDSYQSSILFQLCSFSNNSGKHLLTFLPLSSNLFLSNSSFAFNTVDSILHTNSSEKQILIDNSTFVGENPSFFLSNTNYFKSENSYYGQSSIFELDGGNFTFKENFISSNSKFLMGNLSVFYSSENHFQKSIQFNSKEDTKISTTAFTQSQLESEFSLNFNVNNFYFYENQVFNVSFNQIMDKFLNLERTLIVYVVDNSLEGDLNPLRRMIGGNAIEISGNQFDGNLPNFTATSYPNLWYLSLANNQLSGMIPDSTGTLRGLSYLDLSNNYLSGTIPSSLQSLTNLIELHLHHNQLEGVVPNAVASLNMNLLDASFNHLTKMNILSVTHCDLSNNPIICPISSLVASKCGISSCLDSPFYFCRLSDDCSLLSTLSSITHYIIEGSEETQEVNFKSLVNLFKSGLVTNFTTPDTYCNPLLQTALNLSVISSIEDLFSLCGKEETMKTLLSLSHWSVSEFISRLESNPKQSNQFLFSIGEILNVTFPSNQSIHSDFGRSVSFSAINPSSSVKRENEEEEMLQIPSTVDGKFITFTFSPLVKEFIYILNFKLNWIGGRIENAAKQTEVVGMITAASYLGNEMEGEISMIQPLPSLYSNLYNYNCRWFNESMQEWSQSYCSTSILEGEKAIQCKCSSFGYFAITRTLKSLSDILPPISDKPPSSTPESTSHEVSVISVNYDGMNASLILGAVLTGVGIFLLLVTMGGIVWLWRRSKEGIQ